MSTSCDTGGLVPAHQILAGMSLFHIEEGLALLAEVMDEEGSDEALDHALMEYMTAALEKRDRVAGFIRYCEAMVEAAKAEEERLSARRRRFENQVKRLKDGVIRLMDCLGYSKLEGRTSTLAKRKCPPAVLVTDAEKVPSLFKRQTVTLPLDAWTELISAVPDDLRAKIEAAILKQDIAIELLHLKSAVQQKIPLEGATLAPVKYYLHIS